MISNGTRFWFLHRDAIWLHLRRTLVCSNQEYLSNTKNALTTLYFSELIRVFWMSKYCVSAHVDVVTTTSDRPVRKQERRGKHKCQQRWEHGSRHQDVPGGYMNTYDKTRMFFVYALLCLYALLVTHIYKYIRVLSYAQIQTQH